MRNSFRKTLGLTLFFISVLSFARTSRPVSVSNDQRILINDYIQVYHSADALSGQEAWDKISKGELAETLKKVNPGMSFPQDSYWVVFSIENTSTENMLNYLEIDYPQMDFIELFGIYKSGVKSILMTGDEESFDQRPIIDRNFILPIELKGNRTQTYLLHLRKFNSTVRFPLYLHTESGYKNHHFISNLLYSLYFGILILVVLVALFLGFLLKNETLKIYSLYVLSFALWLFTRLGYSYQFLSFNFPEFNRHLLSASGQLAIMGLVLYVRSFFKTKESLPGFHKVMSVVLIIFILGSVVWILFPDQFVAYATKLFILRYLLFSSVIIFAFTAAINYHKINLFKSRMFLLGYSVFLLAIIGKMALDYSAFNEQSLPFDPIIIGYIIEVGVLSTAMGVLLKRKLNEHKSIQLVHQKLQENVKIKEKTERSGYLILTSKALIKIDQISYIKADDHYLEFYLIGGKKQIDRNAISKLIAELPPNFIQTHRSFIINLEETKAIYSDKVIMNTGDEIKISRTYKKKNLSQIQIFQKS